MKVKITTPHKNHFNLYKHGALFMGHSKQYRPRSELQNVALDQAFQDMHIEIYILNEHKQKRHLTLLKLDMNSFNLKRWKLPFIIQ